MRGDHDAIVRAQHILTGEWVTQDLPINGLQYDLARLSGPPSITGSVNLADTEMQALELEPWGTWLHVEMDGQIHASGILLPWTANEEGIADLECIGFSGYPHNLNVLYAEYAGIQVDPLDVVREIWDQIAEIQDLGITVDATVSPIKIGTPASLVDFNTAAGERVTFTAGPVMLNWWTAHNYGRKLDELAKETPFDYSERVRWNSTRSAVEHHLLLGYPRLGTARTDLTFVEGENIVEWVPTEEDDELYASDVLVTGAGEGLLMVRGYASNRIGKRIRRTAIISDASIKTKAGAEARARDELARRQALISVETITVDAKHPNAPIGKMQAGDDVPIRVDMPYTGEQTVMHRILNISYKPDQEQAILTLRPSSTFNYGRIN